MREGGEHKKISGLIILCHRCVILCNRSIILLTDLFIVFPFCMPFLESSKKCFTFTDYDIEGTEIEGTVLKFLKNKGHQYWNLLPQGTGEIQI